MSDLTPRQTAMLEFIRRFLKENEYPPTVREIGRGVGLSSPSSVHAQLWNLEQAGVILRPLPGKPRTLRVLVGAAE